MIEDVNSYSHPPGKYSDSELQAIKDLLEVMIFFIDDTPHTNNKQIWFEPLKYWENTNYIRFSHQIDFHSLHRITEEDLSWEGGYKLKPQQIEDILKWMQTQEWIRNE
ncbi:Uncharacterised protein [Streptococcus suis]|uniref:hypothetical protein n=1 Tax=Streptococcus suis TaxID=1307 RepID=UPI0003F77191|nr:hypothetical protein [Streptococcus suis]VTT13078.1 Uncharacterised protein [Streptococcus suis]HEM3201915.1 hypothetical protein [Streptococcus suis]HEM4242117.1 hypothetical protein [Streptococcus suis]HEM5404967.1 hypothetical protein [Streptococcus suis]